jgi:hypothetical protein
MKKRISIFLAIVLVLSIGLINIQGRLASAEGTPIDAVANKLSKIYSCMDPSDILNIHNAKVKISQLASDDAEWNTILDSSILTETVKTSLGGEVSAKAALIKFIKDLAAITYSGDLAALKTSLTNFKTSNLATYQSLFGTDVTIDDFYQLFINAEAAFPSVISGNTTWRDTIAHGTYADLIAIVPNVVKEAIVQGMNPTLVGKLSSVGWSMDILKTKLVALIAYADTANQDAQISTAKAIVRSEATLTVDPAASNANVDNATIDGSQTDLLTYTLSIMGYDSSGLVNWKSSNPSVAAFGQGTFGSNQLVPLSNGNTTITVYRQGAAGVTTTPEADWIVKAFTLNVTGFASIDTVTATNGTIAAVFNSTTSITPNSMDFTATYTTDGTTYLPLTINNFVWSDSTKTANFNFTPIAATTTQQSVTIKLTYNGVSVNSNSFIIPSSTPANTIKCGDINGDGVVSLSDALEIAYYKANMFTSMSAKAKTNIATKLISDINGDGVISLSDALEIKYFKANMFTSMSANAKARINTILN